MLLRPDTAEKLCHNYRKLFSCLTALYSLTLIVVTIGVTGGGNHDDYDVISIPPQKEGSVAENDEKGVQEGRLCCEVMLQVMGWRSVMAPSRQLGFCLAAVCWGWAGLGWAG